MSTSEVLERELKLFATRERGPHLPIAHPRNVLNSVKNYSRDFVQSLSDERKTLLYSTATVLSLGACQVIYAIYTQGLDKTLENAFSR